MKAYRISFDAPHAETGTAPRTIESTSIIEIANQIAGLAHDNPGKEFTIKVFATDVPE